MNKDKAKVILALRAVKRLHSDGEPWTMRELFGPRDDSDTRNSILAKYANQKTWQRDFIHRLIEEEVVEKIKKDNHHVAYRKIPIKNEPPFGCDQMDILEHIILEGDEDNPGPSIKWFVFPSSYDPPEWYAGDEDEDDEEEETWDPAYKVEVSEVPSETDEVALTSLQLLTQVSEHLVEIRQSHKNLTDRFETLEASQAKVLELLPHAIGDSIQIVHDRSFEKLEKGVHAKLDAMAVALSALIDECRKLIANVGMADKVSNLKSQLDIFNNIVQSLHTQSKDFAAGMETVLDVMGEMEENATESTR
jgi:hypothetical protein